MPLGPGVRYRVKNGVRLAFKNGKVVEHKSMKDILADNIRKRKARKK
jgi:hypothetical protein